MVRPMQPTLKIALAGAGMFGGDVHLRAFADLQLHGIAGQLARVGLDAWTRDLAPVRFELAAIATRSAASAQRAAEAFRALTGHTPAVFHGDAPWEDLLRAHPGLDIMAVATPDPLHTPVILAALRHGADVLTEKPMCLCMREADQIIQRARAQGRIVAVDMHKRYDPDHQRIRNELLAQIGAPLYGSAYLEEPLSVSTSTFKWVEASDPFTYVGPHWTDLILTYFGCKPVSLTAVGQKRRLVREGINAYDAVQLRVEFDNGLSFNFFNNWITPPGFEGPVNQGHEIVGADGKIESDQQYRGLRWWSQPGASRTANTHFTRDIPRPDGSKARVGYGVDSLTAGLAAICRVRLFGASRDEVAGVYPTAEEARLTVAIIQAAARVRDLNFDYLARGLGAPVTARFGPEGITLVDPVRAPEGPEAVFQRIYDQPV